MKILLSFMGLIIVSAKVQGQVLNLDSYKKRVESESRQLQSYRTAIEASQYKQQGGDVVLAPLFFAQAARTDDQKPPVIPQLGTRTMTDTFTLGFQKKFSTGTSATVSSTLAKVDIQGSAFNDPYPSKGSLGLSVSQSLWKDGFGRGTSLRRQRERVTQQLETYSLEAQKQGFLIQAETAFWDLWYLQEELSVRQNSIERAKRLESWTAKRLNNGIGDKADLLQAQTLSSSRDLQLLMTQDDLQAAQRKILTYLEQTEFSDVKVTATVQNSVALESLAIDHGSGDFVTLEAYLADLQAQLKSAVSQETREGLKPDLLLEGSYATNSQAENYSGASQDISKGDKPTTTVALKFSMPFGDDVASVKKSAALDFESTKTAALKKWEDALVQWQELKRRSQELLKKIEVSEKLTRLSQDKLSREQQRLNQGRSTTAQVITFEQDAADTQLTLLKLKTERKKLEIQARLFIKTQRNAL